jgi:hypothetical protein
MPQLVEQLVEQQLLVQEQEQEQEVLLVLVQGELLE